MVKKTIHVPDELWDRVDEYGSMEDSFSGIVQDALREYLDGREDHDAGPDPTEQSAD